MSLSIIILAAGKGTRMKSKLPKVLHKICGYEMIYYSIREAKKLTNDIEVVLYHEADLIKEAVSKYFDDIEFVMQDLENYPGTGGAVMNCKPKNEKVLILNADMPLVEAEELKGFEEIDADIVMSVIELDNPSGYGRVVIKDGEVKKIVEEKDATEEEKKIKTVNAGVYLIKKELLEKFLPKLNNDNKQKEYYLTDIIELAKKEGYKIAPLFVKEEHFKGVNSKYDLANAEILMQNRIKKRLMLNGVIMRLPDTIYIEEGVEFEGECIIENGVSIYKGSKIVNSHIKTNTVIEDSEIVNSSVGPLARIRPGSKIVDTHIGNFVEVKKSTLKGVKAGHLSYLGDSEIDEGTNIGAGTITCNYDGIRKYKTIIGKNVFVGSDTQIVAPVKIEDDVLIAAGTTVNRDVPKGSLAISRLGMKTVSGFFYKFFSKKEGD
ncbi:MAG: bifunctional UDP-N-acetylglucosamine diphosphorylase/glucosamine-1-phosphate N-acetyltransferase GlmU [Epsilonproteobacteria bacterium]|nr:bifunctional UDP-N-acetylglucosamine diphosphorylase/glucosamine-1-phosphate N-acetyltransferase GlmU [Campylobacterota bacterium]